MKFFIRIITLFCILSLLLSTVMSASAVSYEYDGKLESETVLLVNMDTGIPVLEKNADVVRYPAALTMIMTFIIVSENVEDFENTKVEIRQDVLDVLLGTGSTTSGVDRKVGEKMSVKDLVYCMMVASGIDATLVLADYVGGGSIDRFVDMMNEKAKELGCVDTNFVNPHGLHDEMQRTTARDLYTIASYALSLPYFSEISDEDTYYCEGDDWPLTTTNYMIDLNRGGDYFYTYAKGIKTGATEEAGRCLITTAIADGYAYMCICMGASYETDYNGAMRDAKELLRWALLNLRLSRLRTTDTPVCEIDVNFSTTDKSILLYPKENVNTILPKDYDEQNISVEPNIPETVDAPIKAGDIIGSATVYYLDEAIQTVDLVAGEDVARSPVAYAMFVIKGIVTSWIFWLAIIIALVLLVVYIYLAGNVSHKKKQRRVKKYRRL